MLVVIVYNVIKINAYLECSLVLALTQRTETFSFRISAVLHATIAKAPREALYSLNTITKSVLLPIVTLAVDGQ